MDLYRIDVNTLGKNAKKKWVVADQRNILIKGKMGALRR